jgi:hypothetical protein
VLPSILTNTVPFSNSDNSPCSEHIRLSEAIAHAVKDVDAAKAEQGRARMESQDVEMYTVALADVRKQARLLVAALAEHRKQHGCS